MSTLPCGGTTSNVVQNIAVADRQVASIQHTAATTNRIIAVRNEIAGRSLPVCDGQVGERNVSVGSHLKNTVLSAPADRLGASCRATDCQGRGDQQLSTGQNNRAQVWRESDRVARIGVGDCVAQ